MRYISTEEYCCQKGNHFHVQIHRINKNDMSRENEDGRIDIFYGKSKEPIEVVFPNDATPDEKFMLIGNAMLYDYFFFEFKRKF